ncbi:hypothetical protein ABI_08820 [Asticcacaulis biprosthecium C19]|uniref:Mu-like prophage protein gp16 n=1 Tax=Asticcacaulis biprosthecium C19 TaxID=715226 RepID=F4QGB8_9CAUL|nr:regulatory protein GemA [Asticcacaulis biprosthecium]EGF92446.1 hypothetical protein ABI_08820 [Asticcacaulis biprosthecium C19]
MSALLSKVQIGRKELGLHEDDYRATLKRLTGQDTAKGLGDRDLLKVIEEFKRRGWVPKVVQGGKKKDPSTAPRSPSAHVGRRSSPASSPVAKKARALWISLYQLGVVQNSSERALEAFGARQLKVDALIWADDGQMFKLIEALKGMATRAGWSQHSDSPVALARDLVKAQCRKLSLMEPADLANLSIDLLRIRAAELGERIRSGV